MSDYNYDINDIKGVIKQEGKEDFEWFDEELAIAHMLIDGELYINNRQCIEQNWDGKDTTSEEFISTVFVSCNDVFAWATADGEALPYNEIQNLFLMWHEDKTWGCVKWVCVKRNMQPQKPMVDMIKKAEKWCSLLESLPKNKYEHK